jgi:hypothetical protein
VEYLTNRHIQTAERNRTVALAHLDARFSVVQPPAYEWAAVIAFYAAVHYVNAYLWEIRRYAPSDHDSRGLLVTGDPVLRPCRYAYQQLLDAGFRARYTPGFRLIEPAARELAEVHLGEVRRVVREALSLR